MQQRQLRPPEEISNWSGDHACGWGRNAPEFGELAIGDQFEKHSDPLGILVNADGRRFVDEGADFHRSAPGI